MKHAVFLSLTLGALAILAAGCGRHVSQQGPPPAAVTVAPVEQKEIVEWSGFTGRPSRLNRWKSGRALRVTSRKCVFNRDNW